MANSTAKRYSLLGLLYIDGTVSASDRLTLLGLYGGIPAGGAVTPTLATGVVVLSVSAARRPSISVGTARRPAVGISAARRPVITVTED